MGVGFDVGIRVGIAGFEVGIRVGVAGFLVGLRVGFLVEGFAVGGFD
jgi:hypothetical protein